MSGKNQYFVFPAGITPLRNMVLGRYPAFLQKLVRGPCAEVSVMAEVASRDARTVTAGNIRHLNTLTKLNCATECKVVVKRALPVKEVPERETWRTGLLDILLRQRSELEKEGSDSRRVNAMLASLCYS